MQRAADEPENEPIITTSLTVPHGTSGSAASTSLRASSVSYSGFQLHSASAEHGISRVAPGPRGGAPRIIQRAAMRIRCAEDILAACMGAELVGIELGLAQRALNLLLHAVTELGQNLLLHATDGTMTLAQLEGPLVGIEVFAQDHGPGIPDVSAILRRPADTTNGPFPAGLRGLSQIADEFDVHTGPSGTHVRVVIYG